jgi:penicillin-binding protein 1A
VELAASPTGGRPRLKKLRFLLIFLAVLLLGLVSFVFGMFMAVASDLPAIDDRAEFNSARNSVLLDDLGHPLGVLSRQNQILVTPGEIPAIVKDAVISIEDKRFRTNSGVDVRGITRAVLQDVVHQGAVQGASTIEQQFVKNALQAQSHRTILEKLREALLAYQLALRWPKEKIVTEYLNTIYFGNGAYGIEAAARTYFGQEAAHQGCGTPRHQLCVEQLQPAEAALLAGIIQSPTDYNPVTNPAEALARRNVVLEQMLAQHYLTQSAYDENIAQPLPAPHEIQPPHTELVEGVDAGYFVSWATQQLIERYGAERTFDGGLRIRTTLDLGLQRAAERAVESYLANPEGPTAALVAIENSTGEVRAMVGGRSFQETPFNLATQGERQPGSSFKAFDLAAALQAGISPDSVWPSEQKTFRVHGPNGPEKFVVHNDEGAYTGSNTLTGATAYSDNSIYAEVGLKVGTQHIADLAHRMGITTPISTNAAMTIGGLSVGVTPLDMAHAYETIAHGGQRVSGTLVSAAAPVGIQEVAATIGTLPDGHHHDVEQTRLTHVLPGGVAETETSMLETVLEYGTARVAAIGQFAAGKTGTTSNFGDAWFVGWDHKYTVAVWVGYPNKLIPMTTAYDGQPVFGGTYPALIWRDFMLSALRVEAERTGHPGGHAGGGALSEPSTGASPASVAAAARGRGGAGANATPTQHGAATHGTGEAPTQAGTPPTNSPAPTSAPAPTEAASQPEAHAPAQTPAPATAPSPATGGGSGGSSGGASGGTVAPGG